MFLQYKPNPMIKGLKKFKFPPHFVLYTAVCIHNTSSINWSMSGNQKLTNVLLYYIVLCPCECALEWHLTGLNTVYYFTTKGFLPLHTHFLPKWIEDRQLCLLCFEPVIIIWLSLTCPLRLQVAFPIQVRHIHWREKNMGELIGKRYLLIQRSESWTFSNKDTSVVWSYLAPWSQHSPWECWWPKPTRPGWCPDPQWRKALLLSLNGKEEHPGPRSHKWPDEHTEIKRLKSVTTCSMFVSHQTACTDRLGETIDVSIATFSPPRCSSAKLCWSPPLSASSSWHVS